MTMPALSYAVELTSLSGVLGTLALRATIVLAAATAATLAMRRASAATRHLVWSGAFAGVLLLPFLGATLPAWRLLPAPAPVRVAVESAPRGAAYAAPAAVVVGAPPRLTAAAKRDASRSTSSARPVHIAPPTPASTEPGIAGARDAAAESPRTSRLPAPVDATRALAWPALLALVWLGGVALLLARLLAGTLTLRGVVGRTLPVDDVRTRMLAWRLETKLGIARRVRLLGDPEATVPMTWGIAAPVVVLPLESVEWSDERLRLVLAHELAHVARLDGATQLVAQLATAIFWFHPLTWLALRALRRERERACDDLVLATGTRASDYARDLVELATRLAPSPSTVAAFGMARRSELEGRVRAILDPRLTRGRTGWRAASLALAGAVALTLVAATVARRDAFAAGVGARQPRTGTVRRPADARVAAATTQPDDSAAVASQTSATPSLDGAIRPAPVVAAIEPGAAPPVAAVIARDAAGPAVDTVPAGPAPQADRATLLMVADAAKRIRSDAEKSTLLQAVYRRYRTDDGLRAAYLGVVATLTGDNARAEALLRMVQRDTLSPLVMAQAIAIAAATTSDYERGRSLQALAAQPALSNAAAHQAFFQATSQLSSSTTEASVLGAVLRRPDVSESDLLSTMAAAAQISSSNDAANVLVAVVRRHALDTDALRNGFSAAARRLSSDTEFRRVMSAAAMSF